MLFKALAIVILIGAASWVYFGGNISKLGALRGTPNYASQQGVSPLIVSTTKAPPKYALHILFLGNSFTFYHDIPRQVADIASADPDNPTQFFVQSVTLAGKSLKELWDGGQALPLIQSGPSPGAKWDYVVLQEQSSWAMVEVFLHSAYVYARNFDAVIKQAKAKTLLELTWVNKPGSPLYSQYGYLRNPDYMYKQFADNTDTLAKKLGVQVVWVGSYWQLALSEAPEIELYEADGHHPSVAGSYLAALVFYRTLTGRDLMKINFRPNGVSADDAAKIRTIVSQ